MGYTHYWRVDANRIDLGEYRRTIARAAQIVRESPVALGDAIGEGDGPELSDERLAFNGIGTCDHCDGTLCNYATGMADSRYSPHDAGHETFSLPFALREPHPFETEGEPLFEFCKTAQKSYDLIVTAVLAVMDEVDGFSVSSDGAPDNWAAGVAFARTVLGDETIVVPSGVTA